MIKPNSTILFQGDSITDTGRNREIAEPNRGAALGSGYVNLIAARLLQERPQDKLNFYNRGISGNRVTDLYARWKVDGINLQPDLICLLRRGDILDEFDVILDLAIRESGFEIALCLEFRQDVEDRLLRQAHGFLNIYQAGTMNAREVVRQFCLILGHEKDVTGA